jgi:hypothetical protein
MESSNFNEFTKFKNPEEEIAFLRKQIKENIKSAEYSVNEHEVNRTVENIISEYGTKEEDVLDSGYKISDNEKDSIVLGLTPEEHDTKMEELLAVLQEKGLKNTLSVIKKLGDPHIADDFHRFLIQYIQYDNDASWTKGKGKIFNALNMTLFEITLPHIYDGEVHERTFKEMVSSMEQFYAGMLSISDAKKPVLGKNYFTIEIALSENQKDVVFYASIPTAKNDLFEKQLHALFPNAKIKEAKDDYNIFNESGASVGSIALASKNPIFPIKTYDDFDTDPLDIILNVFSRLKEHGEGAAIQIVFSPAGDYFIKRYGYALDQIRKGVKVKKAIDLPDSFSGGFRKAMGDFVFGTGAPKKDDDMNSNLNEVVVNQITEKVSSTILNTNIRIVTSAENANRAQEILDNIESAFNQFTNVQGNGVSFNDISGRKLLGFFQKFSFRLFSEEDSFPLNTKELTTMMHFPIDETHSPHLRKASSSTAPVQNNMPESGTMLGINKHQGFDTKVYFAPEDRLRHFYTIGQTGTGKTVLLKNMIIQDIKAGKGVCMIDPHGSDIEDVLANIPPERIDDVIYFDPADIARPMGLNMLEYDARFPEQKTFVVNEMLSIFNKLFDMQTAGGPMFEQYFRNATMLVIEDPESGNTLLDISRVLSDEKFREMKLSRCNNPIVVQFWREIAGKADGEASLSNIVPYITSKFDVFLSNEIMRPIIAQEKSAFNFRQIMDDKKILLVNLSKGRLGDINSNLLGLILVGKILMAALSRVDSIRENNLPPFYLYIDEFQNVTTTSITTILSEARKYGLSLNIFHQFIKQLDDNIKDAVFGNVGSMAVFRVGTEDAEFLQKQFVGVFTTGDITNLDNYNAYLKMLVNGQPGEPFNIQTLPPEKGTPELIDKIKQLSHIKYGRDRAEIESRIMEKYKK